MSTHPSMVISLEEQLALANKRIAELEALVTIDPLTEIANRRGVIQRLEAALAAQKRSGGSTFVAFIDLDGFKALNDALGHQAGDGALIVVAHRLLHAVRPDDVVGRVGGDEFVIVGHLDSSPDGWDKLQENFLPNFGQRLVNCIREPIPFNESAATLGASVGIIEVTSTSGLLSAEDVINQADKLMYSVKRNGKNGCSIAHTG